jgi:ribose-phosphate pyrophosphokinase
VKLFALDPYREMGRSLAQLVGLDAWQAYRLRRFANGELQAILECDVALEDCYVLGTVEPPEENLVELSLFSHTLQRNGAAAVWALLPYTAYARQDQPEPGRSMAARWIFDLLQASGVSGVYTFDLHNRALVADVSVPVVSISTAPAFARILRREITSDWTLVAPDFGAIARCDRLESELGVALGRARFDKRRTESGVSSQLVGAVTEKALIYDDILDTGETLVRCCEGLRSAGARSIVVAVTHGLFTGTKWQELWNLGVTRIICTDSVQPIRCEDPRIEIVPCVEWIAQECGLIPGETYVENRAR